MAVNKVVYNAKVLLDLTSDTVTPEKLAEGVTAHDKSGNKITGAMATNTKSYEVTLAKSSGWVLLTTLDDEVLAHINDASLVVSLANISPYVCELQAGSMYIASNTPWGYSGEYPAYGLSCLIGTSETACSTAHIYYPPNYTGTSTSLGGRGIFRLNNSNYYIRPASYFVRSGTYRLTFTW